jgi:hypothetical protein
MSGHHLQENFIDNLEALLRKKRTCAPTSSAIPPTTAPLTFVSATTTTMAQKSLREFSISAVANVTTRSAVNLEDKNFEIYTGLIIMVQVSPFCGLPSEDANAHLQ